MIFNQLVRFDSNTGQMFSETGKRAGYLFIYLFIYYFYSGRSHTFSYCILTYRIYSLERGIVSKSRFSTWGLSLSADHVTKCDAHCGPMLCSGSPGVRVYSAQRGRQEFCF